MHCYADFQNESYTHHRLSFRFNVERMTGASSNGQSLGGAYS